MNDINEKQNQDRFIEFLKAQRVAYSQCKNYQFFDSISVLSAVVLPIIGLINNQCINALSVVGVVWTILYLIAEKFRKKKADQGAKIQEEFDTELFNIPWNDVLCKKKITKEIQIDLASKYNKNDLYDWYSTEIGSELPQEIAIILCQRINSSWEARQKKNYSLLLLISVIAYYSIFIITSIIINLGLYDTLLLLAPSISFLIYSVENICSLNSQISEKEDNIELIDNLINDYKVNHKIPSITFLRQIQDVIYCQRSVPEKIPDWFYKKFKIKNEDRTNKIIKSIKSSI